MNGMVSTYRADKQPSLTADGNMSYTTGLYQQVGDPSDDSWNIQPNIGSNRPTQSISTSPTPTYPAETLKQTTSPPETPKRPTFPPETLKYPTSPPETIKRPTFPSETLKRPTSPPETLKYPTSPHETLKRPTSPLETLKRPGSTRPQDVGHYENLKGASSNDYETIDIPGPTTMTDQNRIVFETPRYEIDLLLIGKTGQGKSALGNSILGRKVFESRPSFTSVTKAVSDDVVEYKGKVIKVVDGPGVGDTDLTDEEAKNTMVNSLSEAISINHLMGYHAFLLVVKFGERYTRESRMTVKVLKKVFGSSFVKNFCVLVMTFGDLFEEEGSFREWLDEQKGDLKELVEECDNRVILYDNKTKDKGKRDGQLDALLDIIKMLSIKNGRYTNEQFDLAKLSRESMTLEPEKITIQEEFMKEAILMLKTLQLLQADTENVNTDQTYISLEQLSFRTITLLEKLKSKDKNTGILLDLISHFQSLSSAITDEMRLVQRISKLMKKKIPEVQRKLSDKIRYQKSVFYVSLVEGVSLENAGSQGRNIGPGSAEEDDREIDNMKVQWEKTRELEAQQKEMKKINTSNIVSSFQSNVRTSLTNNLREKSKGLNKEVKP